MTIPNLNTHLEWYIPVKEGVVPEVANVLIEEGTCFAVIGGESAVLTTKRGYEVLKNTARGWLSNDER